MPQQTPVTIFEDDRFRVTDHGGLGIQVEFRTDDGGEAADGSKWFMDAVAGQVRDFVSRGPEDRAARLLAHLVDVNALPRIGVA